VRRRDTALHPIRHNHCNFMAMYVALFSLSALVSVSVSCVVVSDDKFLTIAVNSIVPILRENYMLQF